MAVGLGKDRHARFHPRLTTRACVALVLLLSGCVPASSPAGAGSPILTPPPEGTPGTDVATLSIADALNSQATPYDQQFIDTLVPRLQGEVALAQVALSRAQHLELRALAQEIIDLDTAQISDMQLWRRTWFGSSQTPPMAMSKQVEALRSAPEPFDAAFIDAMLPLQDQSISEAKEALLQAGAQQILDLAGEILADRSRFALQMQGWRAQW